MNLSLIAAVAENGVIGNKNDLPWQVSSDLKYFAKITKGKTVIMGRKTYDAIIKHLGHPLPDRQTIVLTSHPEEIDNQCRGSSSWEDILGFIADKKDESIVIGGRGLYELALPVCSKLYLTKIHGTPVGDTFFPDYEQTQWELVESTFHPKEVKDDFDCTFNVYERREDKDFVNIANGRTTDQITLMEKIKKDGVCPFCPEHLRKYHPKPILKESDFWFVTENMSPYPGTKFHFLFIAKRHFTLPAEMTEQELIDWHRLVNIIISEKEILGGALVIRFGDTHFTGGSVDHFHSHLIMGDVDAPGHQSVKVKVG